MRTCIVETGLGAGERHAVVAGDHHDGVVELAILFQGLDRAGNRLVEMLDLHEVIEKVAPDDRVVGEDRRNDHLGGVLSHPSPRAFLVAAMGFVRPQPEAKGLALRNLSEEVIKIPRIVLVGHAFEGRLQRSAVEAHTSRVDRSTSRLESPGTPPLAGISDGVTRIPKQLRIGRELGRQGAVDIAGFFQPPDMLPGQDGAA